MECDNSTSASADKSAGIWKVLAGTPHAHVKMFHTTMVSESWLLCRPEPTIGSTSFMNFLPRFLLDSTLESLKEINLCSALWSFSSSFSPAQHLW